MIRFGWYILGTSSLLATIFIVVWSLLLVSYHYRLWDWALWFSPPVMIWSLTPVGYLVSVVLPAGITSLILLRWLYV